MRSRVPLLLTLCACAGETPPAGTTGLARVEGFPCVLEEVAADVVRLVAPEGVADPGTMIVRDVGGGFVSTSQGVAQLQRWSAEGRFLGTIGRRGPGPGEFDMVGLTIFRTPEDSFYVGRLRDWSVFDGAWHFVRTGPRGPLTATRGSTHFLRDGRIATGWRDASSMGDRVALQFASRAGDTLAAIAGDTTRRWWLHPSAWDGAATLWTASGVLGEAGYRLARWDTAGRLLEEHRRVAPWFVPARTPPRTEGGETIPGEDLAWVLALHAAPGGTLFVVTEVTGPAWRDWMDTATAALPPAGREWRIEVLDGVRGEVLASRTVAVPGDRPRGFLAGEATMVRRREDERGDPVVELVPLRLADAPGARCTLR